MHPKIFAKQLKTRKYIYNINYIIYIILNIILYIYNLYHLGNTFQHLFWGYQSSDNGNLSCSGSAPKEPPSSAKEAQQEADGASSREPEAGSSSRTEGQGSRCYGCFLVSIYGHDPFTLDFLRFSHIYLSILVDESSMIDTSCCKQCKRIVRVCLEKYVIRQFKWVCLHIICCSV